MLIEYLIVIGLALAPISECRGAIIFGLGMGLNPIAVFLLSTFSSILVIPIIFWILKKANFRDVIHKLFGKQITRQIEKYKKKFELYEELALILFVAIPLPFTGAYMAAIIADIVEINKRKAWLVIAIGVLIASILVFSGVTGIEFLYNIFKP